MARPGLLGDARLYLPKAGIYLSESIENDTVAGFDYRDPEIGYRYLPNTEIVQITCGDVIEFGRLEHLLGRVPYRRVVYRIDDDGFRGFCGEKSGDADIVAVGDSFTVGFGVPGRLAWPAILGRTTGRRVYNMGVAGAGPEQEFRLFRKLGIKRNPRTVLWQFFEGNDLGDAVAFRENLAEAGRGVRMFEGRLFPDPRFKRRYECSLTVALLRWWSDHSETSYGPYEEGIPWGEPANGKFSLLPASASVSPDDFEDDADGVDYLPAQHHGPYDRSKLLPNRRWQEVPAVRESSDPLRPALMTVAGRPMQISHQYLDTSAPSADNLRNFRGYPITREAVRDFAALCRGKGIRLVMVYVPTAATVYWEWMRPGMTEWSPETAAKLTENLDVCRDLIAETCRAEGVEFLDLTPSLRERAGRGEYVYFHHDSHLSPVGHQVAADAIARFLGPKPASPGPTK